MNDFLRDMKARGCIHQCTDEDGLAKVMQEPITAYIGFDCTGPSLHVGHLMSIMSLRRLQQAGHKPIVLMGGGTTKVGDPSGKDKTRPTLTDEMIEANMSSIKRQFSNFLDFGEGSNAAIMVNNDDWLSKLNYIQFLRDVGRHFSVNHMLSMESVKLRLEREQHLSFIEFNYMILQAYDFVELNRHYGCRLQLGGSDQWGNIVNGVELNRKLKYDDLLQNDETRTSEFPGLLSDVQGNPTLEFRQKHSLFGLTTPLITTADGRKMGKTEGGAVWLDADMCSPYDYWQFWRNTDDRDVGRFLNYFTDLPVEEIATIMQGDINEAKKRLATEATAMCHGADAASEAADTARKVFELGVTTDSLPTVELAKAEFGEGLPAFALFQKAGLAASGGEARRLIRGGGARINDEKIEDENQTVTLEALGSDGSAKLSAGKKKHILLKVS